MPRLRYSSIIAITLLFMLAIVLADNDCNAKKIRQSHKMETIVDKNSKAVKDETAKNIFRIEKNNPVVIESADLNAISVTTDSLKFAGYDKPLNSSHETFHLINSNEAELIKIGLSITYLDLKNRMLHARDIPVEITVPGRETRLVTIPSWDIQKSFFFYQSAQPKKNASPYKVRIEVEWAEFRMP